MRGENRELTTVTNAVSWEEGGHGLEQDTNVLSNLTRAGRRILPGSQFWRCTVEFNALFEQLRLAVIALWSMTEVRFLVGSVFLNVVIAISTSIYTGEFKLYKTAEFLTRKLLPDTLIYAAARVVAGK